MTYCSSTFPYRSTGSTIHRIPIEIEIHNPTQVHTSRQYQSTRSTILFIAHVGVVFQFLTLFGHTSSPCLPQRTEAAGQPRSATFLRIQDRGAAVVLLRVVGCSCRIETRISPSMNNVHLGGGASVGTLECLLGYCCFSISWKPFSRETIPW